MTHGKKRFKLLRKKRASRRRPTNSTTQNDEPPKANPEAEFDSELVTETGDLSTKLEPPFSTNTPRDSSSFDETTDLPVIRTPTPGTTSSEDASAQTRQLANPEFEDCIPSPLRTTHIDATPITEVQYLGSDRGVWCSSPTAPAEMPDTKAGEATQATLESINNLASSDPSGSDLSMKWKFMVIKYVSSNLLSAINHVHEPVTLTSSRLHHQSPTSRNPDNQITQLVPRDPEREQSPPLQAFLSPRQQFSCSLRRAVSRSSRPNV